MNQGDNRNNGYNNSRLILMALVSCYIIYLGGSILKGVFEGADGMPVWAGVLFGVLFIAAGLGYLYYLYRQYQAMKAAEKEEEMKKAAEDSPEKAIEEGASEASGDDKTTAEESEEETTES